MLYFEMAVSMITFLAMVTALILLATGRIKPKPIIPGNVPWIFYLIDQMFDQNHSSAKEVREE
jgi:hypothetical protein